MPIKLLMHFRPTLAVVWLFSFHSLTLASGIEPKEIYERAQATCVEVIVEGRLAGSGWFASKNGHVFTAEHVIHGAPKGSITLRTNGNGEVPAHVVAIFPDAPFSLA